MKMHWLFLLVILVFIEGCGCFFPCLTPGRGLGYGYFGLTPGMVCVQKGSDLICGAAEDHKPLETEDEKKGEQNQDQVVPF